MQKQNHFVDFFMSRFFLLVCAVICFALAHFIPDIRQADFVSESEKFQRILYKKEEHAKSEIAELSKKSDNLTYEELFSEKINYYETLFEREGLVFLIFERDTLRFWTDNTVAVDNYLPKNNLEGKIVKLPNGWFAIQKLEKGEKILFALILLKREYSYQNKYLVNEYEKDFSLNTGVNIVIDSSNVGRRISEKDKIFKRDVYEKKGDYLCTLVFPGTESHSIIFFYLAILLGAFGLVFTVWYFHAEVSSLSGKIDNLWLVVLLFGALFLLRYLSVEVRFPKIFYETRLFSPELYGDASSVWLGSLGDILISVLLLFYIILYVIRKVGVSFSIPAQCGRQRVIMEWMVPFGLFFVLLLSSRIVNYVFQSVILNSSIPFTINDLFSHNIFTYLGLFVLSLLFISYFLLADKVAVILLSLPLTRGNFFIVFGVTAVIFVFISHLLGTLDLAFILWPILLFICVFAIRRRAQGQSSLYSFSNVVVLLFIIASFSTHVVLKFSERKEKQNRRIFAQKLSVERDPLAEYLFTEIENSISTDTVLMRWLNAAKETASLQILPSDNASAFRRELLSRYFSGYWEKYEIRVSVFDTACYPIIQGANPDRDNFSYFEEQISLHGVPCNNNNFFYLTNSSGRLSYLARIPLIQTKDFSYKIGDLFLELDSRVISDEMGFPELMLDRKLGVVQELFDYSYAKYKDGKLIAYHGKYPFSMLADNNLPKDTSIQTEYFFNRDGWSHFAYFPNSMGKSLVVISKKNDGKMAIATTFSYLFMFFSLVVLLLILLHILIFDRVLRFNSFRSRIQYVLVSMALFSLLFFGGGTVYYIKNQYEQQLRQSVRDKMVSALVEGIQELGEEKELKQTKSDYFSYILRRMSNIFLTDIMLYDKNGTLVGSSQMKLFNEGLLSRKMSPEPYYRLAIQKSIEHIQDEKIGNLSYLSAYCSFRNNEGDLLGYLNIPYFARQTELEKEISTILGAIINIYVLLLVISVILALAISEYFTKPLRLIQDKLGKIKLGKASEPIDWKSQDEIGSLVNEYNRMIEELQKSAELLAKSERETAWREMAKQVAHEIKNPLTPMKLSIQHLQRTYQSKDDSMDKKIERITATLIEQIETLSNIASEFSSFAKMPSGISEQVNLKNVLETSLALFKDSNDIQFSFECAVTDAYICADKDQMLRVFNNLIKNAIQAIPENRQGKIYISLIQKDNCWIVQIQDNGIGIAEDKMDKIFLPNFTTKTAGMGLGLAMVKSIVETFGGKIWFETSRGIGTSFFVSLPQYKGSS